MNISLIVLGCLGICYSIYCIYFDYIYMASLFVTFLLPSIFLFYYAWNRFDKWYRTSFAISILGISLCAVVMEIIGIQYEFWTFFEDRDKLTGIRIGNIPIEELIFYYGANIQLCALYGAIKIKFNTWEKHTGSLLDWLLAKIPPKDRKRDLDWYVDKILTILGVISGVVSILLFKKYLSPQNKIPKNESFRTEEDIPFFYSGVWFPGWIIAIAPFLVVSIIIFRKTERKINFLAFLFTFLINVSIYFIWEYNAIMRGHWVYNEQRLIGIKLGVTPIEEFFFYVTAIVLMVSTFEGIHELLIRFYGSYEEKVNAMTKLDTLGYNSIYDIKEKVSKKITPMAA